MEDEGLIEVVFAPGNRLILECADDKGVVKNHHTVVEDLEGAYLILQAPAKVDGSPVSFRESQELTLRRVDGEKSELYVTNVFVIDVRQGKVPLLVCSKPKKIDKTSLRRFSRFSVSLPVKYCLSKQDNYSYGRLNDLSLTGCYLMTDEDETIDEGTTLNLMLTIPGEGEVEVEGKVIRVDKSGEENRNISGIAIDYQKLDENKREILYSFIFQLQLTGDTILGGGIEN